MTKTKYPKPGTVVPSASCTCWVVGPKGDGHLVYRYDHECVMHGKRGYHRGKKFIRFKEGV